MWLLSDQVDQVGRADRLIQRCLQASLWVNFHGCGTGPLNPSATHALCSTIPSATMPCFV
jgi:hypothetical protein